MSEDARSTENQKTDDAAAEEEQDTAAQQPPKRADARIGSAGGGPYPLADPEPEADQGP